MNYMRKFILHVLSFIISHLFQKPKIRYNDSNA